MQPTDLPLVAPLGNTISDLFSDALAELVSLRERGPSQIGQQYSSRPATATPVAPTGMAPPATAGSDPSSGESATAPVSSPSTAQSSKKPISQQTSKSAKGQAAAPGTATSEEFSGPLETPRNAAANANSSAENIFGPSSGDNGGGDPWLAAAAVIAEDEAVFLEDTRPTLEWAKKRFAFFCEKDPKSYPIEDALGDWVGDEAPPPNPALSIDAVALAREHTRRLQEVYGYKVTRGLHEVGKVSPREYSKPDTLGKLESHMPGGATDAPEFACADTIIKNANSIVKGPQPPFDATGGNPRNSSLRKSTKAVPESDAAAVAAKVGNASTKLSASLQKPQLECSMKTIEFRCEPGNCQEVILQLWNTSAYSLRVKIAPSPWERIQILPFDAKTYDPEKPMSPGESFRVRVAFQPVEYALNPLKVVTISFGYTRDLNQIRVTELTPLTQQWQFLEIPVSCLTILPKPTLQPVAVEEAGSSALLLTEFFPMFALTTAYRTRTVINEGSTGLFYLSTSDPEAFQITPSQVILAMGQSIDVTIAFSPTENKQYDAELKIDVTAPPYSESSSIVTSGDVVASLRGVLRGLGVVPSVRIESAGPVASEGLTTSYVDFRRIAEEGFDTSKPAVFPSLVVYEEAAAHHPSVMSVVLRNDSAIAIPFLWELGSVVGGRIPTDASSSGMFKIIPNVGVISAFGTMRFEVELTPPSDESVVGLLSLYLLQMPPDMSMGSRFGAWLSRQRLIPKLRAADSVSMLVDPFGLFVQQEDDGAAAPGTCLEITPQTRQELYAGCLRVSADPKPLKISITPPVLESTVECLTMHANERSFTLRNHSPRDVYFWLDPCNDANHPGAVLSPEAQAAKKKRDKKMKELFGNGWQPNTQRQREDCALTFFPMQGVLAGNSTLEVRCTFKLLRLGRHVIDVECFIDELGKEHSPSLTLIADAVGPSVHVNTTLLDFGVIAVGEESEARFTVTNHNPVNVEFMCLDPIPCDPPRFVFLPPSAALHPGKSIDITVYRQGIIDDQSQTYIEVAVKEGGTQAIEVRSSIQQPSAIVTPACLDLGDMDCAIPKESEVFLSNLSAIDIPFEVAIVKIPPTMSLQLPQGGVLFGGQHKTSIKLKAQFDGRHPDVAVVAVTSTKLLQPILFEVTCSQVNPISVALSVVTQRGDEAAAPKSLSMDTFVGELLWNMVTEILKDGTPLYPHCPPLLIPYATIADDDPFCAVQTRLRVDNRSGCNSKCVVTGAQYIPILSPMRAPASTKAAEARKLVTPPPMGGASLEGTTSSSAVLGGTAARRGSRHSLSGTSNATANQKIMRLKPDQPSFECKQIDGREVVETAQSELRRFAESLLLDGRGCALQLTNATGALKPHGFHEVVATLVSNLPGLYNETLRVSCDGVPPVELKVKLAVRGKPILIDPTTSGLATSSDGLRLTLPSVVAGMNKARRKLRISSRCPRDLEVAVTLRSIHSSFQAVVMPLGPGDDSVSIQGPRDDSAENLLANVTPNQFILPALGSYELVVEFAPPPEMKGEWQATLSITSRIAKTEFNDAFLIDEFYFARRKTYPADRAITTAGLGSGHALSNDKVRSVSKLAVQPPLIDRPCVLRDNAILQPSPTEQLALEVHMRQLRATPSKRKMEMNRRTDDSDDEDDGANDVRSIGRLEGKSKELLLSYEEERQALRSFLLQRREEVYNNVAPYLTPTKLTIVGVIMPAKLVSDPPEMLRFPMAIAGESTTRAIRLTNPTRTPLDFKVELGGPFRITRIDFIAADAEEDVLEEEDDEGLTAKRNAAKLLQGGTSTLKKSLTQLSTIGGTRRTDPNSDPANTLYHLRPRDAVDLTVELIALSTTQLRSKHQIDGSITVLFQGCSLTQTIPCLATVHVPSLKADPEQTWFRPLMLLKDGKPQPKYPRSITLYNYSACPASFTVAHVARVDAPGSRGGVGGETIHRLKKVQSVLKVSPLEEHGMLVDDPTRFTVSPMSGLVPAATVGGAPGALVLHIDFEEFSHVKYECKYRVTVDGGVGTEFVVRGDSREVEI